MTRHHSDLVFRNPSILKRHFFLQLEQYMMKRADRIIAPSQMVREVMVNRQRVSGEKISVIPYGQSMERFLDISQDSVREVAEELGTRKQLSIVYPSRLDHLKGHRYLFEALARLKREGREFKLFLVGSGAYEGELRKLVSTNGLANNVDFLGWRDDVLAIMSNADIIVQPSLSEALSSVTIEAVMLGKPVIATDVSGVRDTLDGGKYGTVVPPADAWSLYSALVEVIDNLESATERSKSGQGYLVNYMSAERTAKEHAEIYRQLIDSK
jgi:glycosyltransferase involved in cell wall biosynthesis